MTGSKFLLQRNSRPIFSCFMTATAFNPYLTGNFAPVHPELSVEDLPVLGTLPPELNGSFVRNGPNPQFPPLGRYHWFDGDGMLHAVQIQNGKASYRNRFIRTMGFNAEQQAGRAMWGGLLEPTPADNPYGPSKNVANTALIWHNDRLLALWEGGIPHEVTVADLETIGPYTFNDRWTSAFTAHPKVDSVTGEMICFGYSLFQPPYVHYGVVSSEGKLLHTTSIDLPIGVMMHDFAITEDYTIFMDLPLEFQPELMQQGLPPLGFRRDRPSRFGILPRYGDNSSIRWFETPSCYIFHTLNAYESGDEVILLACRTGATDVLGGSSDANVHGEDLPIEETSPFLYQWRFNLRTGEIHQTRLSEYSGEFPRINEQYMGRYNRYGYIAKSAAGEMPCFDGFLKYDLEAGTAEVHEFGSGRYGGEGVFVGRSGATAEDDGWLLTYVYDQNTGASELIVVDAQDFTADPVVRVMLPQRVPYGFHGIWIP